MKRFFLIISILLFLLLTGCKEIEKIESIVVEKKEITLFIGESETIEYQVLPENVDEKIILEITDSTIATLVDNVVTGKNFGSTLITLTSSSDATINEKIAVNVIKKTFNILYELDGGYLEENVQDTFEENSGLSLLPTPTKVEYNFIGWYYNGNLITSISPEINQDVTLVAKWQKELDVEAAEAIINSINALPYYTTYNDKAKIDLIKKQYDELSDKTKELVINIDELNQKILDLQHIENDKSKVTYVLGNNIYISKEDLFINFFSDFYKYIITYHGDEYLKDNTVININSIDEFVELARDFDGAGYSNLYGIGHLAGRYMLVKDVNGIIENQPLSGFFGYCYQNGLYKDLLPFFIRFFAYWRIDEKYANQSNYGADTFAEGWAPTVDIAKFFYYDKDNLPTKALYTERMIDCFTNIASVIYTDLPTTPVQGMSLPTDVKLRGYVFEGWYDNPEYTGEKITTISDISEKVILYAKWSVDNEAQDEISSDIVEIYIYNLTTDVANVSKQTIKYVRDMYEKLSCNGKTLVNSYATLVKLEEEYSEYFLHPVTVTITTKINGEFNLDDIRNDFLADFNEVTNSNINSLEKLISNKYSYMKKIGQFFNNDIMRAKWIYLLDILYEEGCFAGLETQINRIKTKGSGDLEYVTVALALLLQGSDASSNYEVMVDYSRPEKVNAVISLYGIYQMSFEKPTQLPSVKIEGCEFLGFHDSNNNLITVATEDMEIILNAFYEKK